MAIERLPLGLLTIGIPSEPGSPDRLFRLSATEAPACTLTITGPQLGVDGALREGFRFTGPVERRPLARGGQETTLRYACQGQPVLHLVVTLRSYPQSPLVRLRYTLTAGQPARLTKTEGQDRLLYLALSGPGLATARLTGIQLSHFDPVAHSYLPYRQSYTTGELYEGQAFAGPIVLLEQPAGSWLAAYEHGADHPLSFLGFTLRLGQAPRLELAARQGNYYHGQPLGPQTPFTSVWFQLAVSPLNAEALLRRYRRFCLEELCESSESRKPYLYYNTWNLQQRKHNYNGRPYLEPINQERMLAEIDVAHRLGVDVFVIDTGWYLKAGDWQVNRERFPDDLQEVRRRLAGYGMRLGLWLNPIAAARTSATYREHPEYAMTWGGQPPEWHAIWETPESCRFCLASGYADNLLEKLVALHDELGVSYYKWDGVGQFGCDSPLHNHGTSENPPEERAACYAYEMGRQMIGIATELSKRCPDAIVDFDITEGGRFVGLGWLAAGKYFLMNHGPYLRDFDTPSSTRIEPNIVNAFFYPGPARSRICRTGVRYDPIIPSILFLTHYLPDPPVLSQMNSLAALMLGGNGIWGDLLSLSEEDVERLATHLADYKEVAGAAVRSYPRVIGYPGTSPEIYEKIDPAAACGLVVMFTVTPGEIVHVTQPVEAGNLRTVKGADRWEILPDGRIKLTVSLERNGARPIYLVGAPQTGE